MSKTVIDDGFAAYLVEGAKFDGKWGKCIYSLLYARCDI